ncbi:branched-chain amino acid ABC transporter permease [Hydrogenibacillus sp. N12]|uniref:branched-chain amino acid ABC transporter permease n=1 Tax=Hydrogenibacillus sp. N12 TaxID=2866627 RepID=UPI001C7DC2F1|nr:branched-chain amino acid ABC transporter permease [Hydrogenibacillus sp. N12]QZA34299.1 branched-chain amino acid ABC transporter permease [Hydrogenibacillus sp. N12]
MTIAPDRKRLVLLFFGIVALYAVVQAGLSAGWIGRFYENMLMNIGINIMLAASLHLIIGVTGQFSIGHAGFLAVGAYTSAVLTTKLDQPFLLAILAAGVVAALFGLFVGAPTLRLRGDYLAIATLGFGEIVRITLYNIDYVGGAAGMQVKHLTNWTVLYGAVVVMLVVIANLTHSAHGRAMLAVREDEVAAEAMGVPTTYYKVLAFAVGAFFAGIAGAMYAHQFYIIQPVAFSFLKSFEILVFVVLGGLGSLSGAVLAATLLSVVNIYLQAFPETRMILYSLVLILVMLYRPQGLMGNRELGDLFRRRAKEA